MRIPFGLNYKAEACLLLSVLSVAVCAQQRPDSGTLLQESSGAGALVAPFTAPDAAQAVIPKVQRALSVRDQSGWTEKVKVTDLQISGNSVFDSATLLSQVAGVKGEVVELSRLVDAIEAIRKYYVDAGYLLTDVYLPEQRFSPEGAIVQIAVVEARIGKLTTPVASGSGISEQKVMQIASASLHPGAVIRQYELEKVVYLLRDLAGVDASAVLTAGARVGEADITIEVFPKDGKRLDTSLTLDNMGARSTGEYRLTALLNVDHPLNMGDQLSLRLQPTNESGNALFRFGYTVPVGSSATKLHFSLSKNNYSLGGAFADLGATGTADVVSATLIQPVIRGRLSNMVVIGGVDHKKLNDNTQARLLDTTQVINTLRFGVLGSSTNERKVVADGQSGFGTLGGITTYSAIATFGNVELTPELYPDEGTRGSFTKVNLDAQRVQFFNNGLSLSLGLSGQFASKNLRGAERVSFGGPNGVRGYPIPSGSGDEGLLASAELRYKTPLQLLGSPVSALAFYDVASIRAKKIPSPDSTLPNSASFSSIGLGLRAGTEGKTTASLLIAKRLGDSYPIPTDGNSLLESERSPQVWFAVQNWF